MIVFGPYTALAPRFNDSGIAIYNINSPMMIGVPIGDVLLIPRPEFMTDEHTYDMHLNCYITQNPKALERVVSLLYDDYRGLNVYVLIHGAPWSMICIESLIKFIQCRYGVEINLVNEPEDLDYVKPTCFTQQGRQIFQADKDKFVFDNVFQLAVEEGICNEDYIDSIRED